MLNIKIVILFLILVLFHSFSYGEPEPLFSEQHASMEQTSTKQTFENQETSGEKQNLPRLDASLLNLKAELGGGPVYGFFSALLEFQTPITKSKKLKWLIQAGAGSVTFPLAGGVWPYVPIDTGLRYDFHPFNISLKGGTHFVFYSKEIGSSFKGSLSMGWNVSSKIHIELSGGMLFLSPFIGLSISIPLMKR